MVWVPWSLHLDVADHYGQMDEVLSYHCVQVFRCGQMDEVPWSLHLDVASVFDQMVWVPWSPHLDVADHYGQMDEVLSCHCVQVFRCGQMDEVPWSPHLEVASLFDQKVSVPS